MCGRFSQNCTPDGASYMTFRRLGLAPPVLPPRYNVAPTHHVPVVLTADGTSPAVEILHWGITPFRRDGAPARPLINARAETLAEKSAFRDAYARRRCLVPVDGFYEWRTGRGGAPYYFTAADPALPLALAGLWQDGAFTIVTTTANALVRSVHHRMPVIVPEVRWQDWLDPNRRDRSALDPLLAPAADTLLTSHSVSAYVNNVAHDGPDCIKSVATLF